MTSADLTATEALQRIEGGSLTAESYARDLLAVCAEKEPEVQAWPHLNPETALAEARALDAGPRRGILHGLPFGVKDIYDVAGMPTTCGSPIHEDAVARVDASSVALARLAGGFPMGKTSTTEFATFKPSPTHNPAAPGHTPGGSSAGSAAAVAAGMVPLAFGSQTAGSVVRPASFCGVWGFKPSFGLIDLAGVKALSRNLDTLGVLARSAEDCALIVEAITGLPLLKEARAGEAPAKIGLCRSPVWEAEAEPELHAAWEEACKRVSAAVPSVEVELPQAYGDAITAQQRILPREASQALAHEWRLHRDLLSPQLATLLQAGHEQDEVQHRADIDLLERLRASFAQDLGDIPVLLTPSAPGAAPKWDHSTGKPIFNVLWTLLGAACVNVPGLRAADGRPIGMQVVAPKGQDALAISVAAWLGRVLA
ncbi:MAG: amidase [Rhodobacteraceae bacterium]|nr:amidase [Paracoccaceae bacterium]